MKAAQSLTELGKDDGNLHGQDGHQCCSMHHICKLHHHYVANWQDQLAGMASRAVHQNPCSPGNQWSASVKQCADSTLMLQYEQPKCQLGLGDPQQ